MPNGYELGRAIAGTLGALRQPSGGNYAAFVDQLKRNYDAKYSMERAAGLRAENLARDQQTAELWARVQEGDPQAIAEVVASRVRMGGTANDAMNALGGAFTLGQRRASAAAVERGDLGAANNALIPIASGPQRMNVIQGGYQINPYEVGGEAELLGTGQARIARDNAAATASYARAAASGRSNRGGGRPRGADLTAERQAQLEAIEQDLGAPLSADQRSEYLLNGRVSVRSGQQRNPQRGEGLPAPRAAARSSGGLNFIDPSNPSSMTAAPSNRGLDQEQRDALDVATQSVRSGKMTRAQAAAKLRQLGYNAAAAQLEQGR